MNWSLGVLTLFPCKKPVIFQLMWQLFFIALGRALFSANILETDRSSPSVCQLLPLLRPCPQGLSRRKTLLSYRRANTESSSPERTCLIQSNLHVLVIPSVPPLRGATPETPWSLSVCSVPAASFGCGHCNHLQTKLNQGRFFF